MQKCFDTEQRDELSEVRPSSKEKLSAGPWCNPGCNQSSLHGSKLWRKKKRKKSVHLHVTRARKYICTMNFFFFLRRQTVRVAFGAQTRRVCPVHAGSMWDGCALTAGGPFRLHPPDAAAELAHLMRIPLVQLPHQTFASDFRSSSLLLNIYLLLFSIISLDI